VTIRRYTEAQTDAFAGKVLRDGFCVLPDHFPCEILERWNEAFLPLLESHIRREGHLLNRGVSRYYVTLPFKEPFNESLFYQDEDLLAVCERLIGADMIMCQLATDTPLLGSEHQDVHRDAAPLFPETGHETPPFQLAVNFPLTEITIDNGPLEIARTTHLISKEEGLRRIEGGEVRLEPVTMGLGDVMIRDVRGLHRGTPNRTDTPRPMVVIGYSRRWLLRPEVSIRIPRHAWDALPPRARRLLRYNPIIDSALELPQQEIYQSFAY
jgi:ectoine hydroxylase-related dioxygenase (phytanoyl-CoA dioxygenase family)